MEDEVVVPLVSLESPPTSRVKYVIGRSLCSQTRCFHFRKGSIESGDAFIVHYPHFTHTSLPSPTLYNEVSGKTAHIIKGSC